MGWIIVVCVAALAIYALSRERKTDPSPQSAATGAVPLPTSVTLSVPVAVPVVVEDQQVELEFRNVFAIMPEARRERLLSFYIGRHRCSRNEAMRMAILDREKDANRAF